MRVLYIFCMIQSTCFLTGMRFGRNIIMSDRKFLRDNSFGNRLKEYRLLSKLSQRDLTIKMHLYGSTLSPSVYSKIENGDNNMYITDFVIYMIVTGVSFDEFFSNLVIEIKRSVE